MFLTKESEKGPQIFPASAHEYLSFCLKIITKQTANTFTNNFHVNRILHLGSIWIFNSIVSRKFPRATMRAASKESQDWQRKSEESDWVVGKCLWKRTLL